jgi:prepilin-type N-terminal cleavage/methylation domain-containing protein
MRGRRGLTLLEVLVALVVLATGVTALERLFVRSIAGIAADERLTRAMLLAQALLAEAELVPPEPGETEGDLGARDPAATGFRFAREVRPTPHPGLREVRIRVYWDPRHPDACELVELLRVPTT